MHFTAKALAALFFGGLVASCGESVPDAPPSAAVPVVPTEAGLFRLFELECLQQRNRDWAVRLSNAYRDGCNDLLSSEGERQNCEADVQGQVYWKIPTTDGLELDISLTWSPEDPGDPRKRRLTCTVMAPEKFGVAFKSAAFRFSRDSLGIKQPLKRDIYEGIEYWASKPEKADMLPAVELDHHKTGWGLAVRF